MLRMLELFGGIGSPRQAIKNLGIKHKVEGYVELWDDAFKTYYLLHDHGNHPESVVDWNRDIDLLVHGSPCQDWSQAGKNDITQGRSILYLRTLEIIEKVINPRPKYVIWENVKGLLNKNNRHHFDHYLNTLESFGYTNYWKVLNSKDFGIPQSRNRVFVVSIRNDLNQTFDFDNLETTPMRPLKEFLEKKVPESYYITQNFMFRAIREGKVKIINNYCETITTKQMRWQNSGLKKVAIVDENLKWTENGTVKMPFTNFNAENVVNNIDSNCQTITAKGAQSRIKVAIPILEVNGEYSYKISDGSTRPVGKINKEGNVTIPLPNNHTQNKVGVDVVPTIMTGANTKIAVPIDDDSWKWDEQNRTNIPLQNYGSLNRVIDSENGEIPTLTTAHGITPFKVAEPVPILETESIDYTNFKTLPRESDGELVNGSYNRYWKPDKYVGTVASSKQEKILEDIDETTQLKENIPIFIIDGKPYYLRILTERECWRLMGWQDEYIDKVIHLPKSKLYHMAGNAIVIQVLEAIFKELLKEHIDE